MLRRAAFASRVVASMPIVLPLIRSAVASTCRIPVKTGRCVSTSINRRVREIVECSGGVSSRPRPRKPRRASESAGGDTEFVDERAQPFVGKRLPTRVGEHQASPLASSTLVREHRHGSRGEVGPDDLASPSSALRGWSTHARPSQSRSTSPSALRRTSRLLPASRNSLLQR